MVLQPGHIPFHPRPQIKRAAGATGRIGSNGFREGLESDEIPPTALIQAEEEDDGDLQQGREQERAFGKGRGRPEEIARDGLFTAQQSIGQNTDQFSPVQPLFHQ